MPRILTAALAVLFVACAEHPVDSDDLLAPEEQIDDASDDLSQAVPVGTVLQATTNVNLRTGPGLDSPVILVIPNGALSRVLLGQPDHGWFKLDYAGHHGWSYGKYHKVHAYPGGGGGADGDWIVARARTAVGFSYHWGHGAWVDGSGQTGSCQGLCPNCSHSGSYGADCSGMVAKAMKVPSSNTSLGSDSHPYSTYNFFYETREWSHVPRGNSSQSAGDAFVWHSGSEGHMFTFERGDAWGSLLAIECKGCAYGCVRGYRTAFSGYKVARRDGVKGAERADGEAEGALASSR